LEETRSFFQVLKIDSSLISLCTLSCNCIYSISYLSLFPRLKYMLVLF